jgi:hypothetical protein
MRKLAKVLLLFIGFAIAVPTLGILALYAVGLSYLVDPLPAPDTRQIPEHGRALIWAEFGGESSAPKRYPADTLLSAASFPPPTATRVAGYAAKFLAIPGLTTLRRHHAELSAFAWVVTHWSPDETLAFIGSRSYFGHEARGLEEAAQTYFSVDLNRLSTAQLALLAGSMRRPSSMNPWCNQDKLIARTHELAASAGLDLTLRALRAALPASPVTQPPRCSPAAQQGAAADRATASSDQRLVVSGIVTWALRSAVGGGPGS